MFKKVTWCLSLMLGLALLIQGPFASAQQPSYAEWGKIAIQETKKQYPEESVTEYTYDGKVFISDERHQYNFDFTLKSNGMKKNVRVYVLVNDKKKELIDVYFDDVEEF
ncbi:DUF3889 domain-containing protein [Alkalihalobacillus sp. CinArs1]|uniref:DUF3889 domain-containing protein n=1 Tax=Alkalihalobacillus sp. CinArs1 TaxID=2995314 RepID=UPI0022DDFE07|nr:DUF3889 domain-containing protein [Alkalihalobacillus sp. CinArs1]